MSGTPSDDSEHDDEIARREAECESLAKKCHRVGSELLEGTDRDCSAGAKVIAEGTKLKRLALEMREMRAEREHLRTLMRHEREMSAYRGNH